MELVTRQAMITNTKSRVTEINTLQGQLTDALQTWGATLIDPDLLQSDLTASLHANGSVHTTALHSCACEFVAMKKIRRSYECGAKFQVVVIDDEPARDRIASHLYHNLSESEWKRLLVISHDQICAVFRWIEDEIERSDSSAARSMKTFITAISTFLCATLPSRASDATSRNTCAGFAGLLHKHR